MRNIGFWLCNHSLYQEEEIQPKRDFIQKYPYAKIDQFKFWVNINQDGWLNPTTIVYKGDGDTNLYNETGTMWKYSWAINSLTFRDLYADSLHWGYLNPLQSL